MNPGQGMVVLSSEVVRGHPRRESEWVSGWGCESEAVGRPRLWVQGILGQGWVPGRGGDLRQRPWAGELAQVVERSLSMREAAGSMPAFSNAFHSPCLDTGPSAWGPLSSGGCGELAVHLGRTEKDSIQGCTKGSPGPGSREGILLSTFTQHLTDGIENNTASFGPLRRRQTLTKSGDLGTRPP